MIIVDYEDEARFGIMAHHNNTKHYLRVLELMGLVFN